MKTILNKKGLSYIETVVWVLVLCMILAIILSYSTMMIQIQTAQSNTERVLDSFVTDNSRTIYNSLKNGHDATRSLDGNYYVSVLSHEMALDYRDSTLYFMSEDGGIFYSIKNLKVDYEISGTLKLQVTYDIVFPVQFAGNKITDLSVHQKVVAYYNVK